MDFKQPHSFGALFVESFKLTNRAFGAFLAFLFMTIVGLIGLGVLMWLGVPRIINSLLQTVYGVFTSVVLMKLFASYALGEGCSLSKWIGESFLPTVYMLILQLVLAGAWVFLGILGGLMGAIGHAPWLMGVLLLIGGVLCVRLCFASAAIALREDNPISAVCYSWQLTQGMQFFYVLGVLLVMALVPGMLVLGVGYGLYVAIPLFFADSFSLVHLSWPWICVLIFWALTFMCACLAMFAYFVLVFLQLDAQQNLAPEAQPMPTVSVEPVEVQTPSPQVQALTAFTQDPEHEGLDQHLQDVYQPKPQDVIEYPEEDRMPTILFDDEMAKQMEADRARWEQEKLKSRQKQNNNDDSGTIKMSK